MNKQALINALLLAAVAMNSAARADDRKADIEFDAGVAYAYDSNVNIAQLDTSVGAADNAIVLNAGVDATIPLARRWTVQLGYAFENTAYEEYPDFDLGLHRASAGLGLRIGTTDITVSADNYRAQLDGERFVDVGRGSLSLAHLFGSKVFLRGAWTGSEERFAELPGRDADGSAFRADAYLLLDGMRHYLAAGFEQGTENAIDPEFDYASSRVVLGYGRQTRILGTQVLWKASLQQEQRRYDNVTEAIEATRGDLRRRAGLTATIQLAEHVDIVAGIEQSRTDSNLDSADIDKLSYRLGLSASF